MADEIKRMIETSWKDIQPKPIENDVISAPHRCGIFEGTDVMDSMTDLILNYDIRQSPHYQRGLEDAKLWKYAWFNENKPAPNSDPRVVASELNSYFKGETQISYNPIVGQWFNRIDDQLRTGRDADEFMRNYVFSGPELIHVLGNENLELPRISHEQSHQMPIDTDGDTLGGPIEPESLKPDYKSP